jgi:Tol biopolymer transport system component
LYFQIPIIKPFPRITNQAFTTEPILRKSAILLLVDLFVSLGVFEMKKIFTVFMLAFPCLPLFALMYQVTNYSDTEVGYPSWSPDGTKIAYHVKVNGKFDIYTISSTGGGVPVRITFSPNYNICPAWSPDSTRIAFTNNNGSVYQMRYVTLSTGQETVVASGHNPRWSPDNSYLVFYRGAVNTYNIWKRALSSGIETQLTFSTGTAFNTRPDWSNDGQTIIYNYGSVNPTLWTVPAVGGTPTQVPLAYGYGPKWSPDDSLITIEAGNDFGGYSIYVFNMITHNLFQATPDSTYWCLYPDWSPDGGKIAYARQSNIWVVTYGVSVEATSVGRLKTLYR